MIKASKLFTRILLWRARHISQSQFILILALLIGMGSGLSAVLLKNTIHLVRRLVMDRQETTDHNFLLLVLPMIGILITILIVKYLVKDSLSHGISQVLYSISKSGGHIKPHHTFSSMIASTFTIAFGGSVGAEAPIVLTGSAIGSNLGRWFRLNHKTITLLIGCGSAGAIGGIFQAPIAGVIFTLEVLMLELTTISIAPLLIAAISGTTVSYFLLGHDAEFSFHLQAPFDLSNLPFYVILGVLGGFVSLYFNRGVGYLEQKFAKISNDYVRWLIGGSILSFLIFIFPPLYGEGYPTIRFLLENNMDSFFQDSLFFNFKDSPLVIPLFCGLLIIFKVVATASTNGAGGVGGVFAPSLFLGGVTGYFMAAFINSFGWVHLPEGHFALTGMAALMAGIMHAPLTAIFLIAEITNGYSLFIPLMITATISYVTIKKFDKHNIYTKRLAQRGELLTHHKDKTVLTLMKLSKVIETDFHSVESNMKLGDLVKIISQSRRNIFPVINKQNELIGVVLLDDIREFMFNQSLYQSTTVLDIMNVPPGFINIEDNMDKVMNLFEDTGAWNLPVLEGGKYLGFVSKSKIFSAYRKVLIHYSDE